MRAWKRFAFVAALAATGPLGVWAQEPQQSKQAAETIDHIVDHIAAREREEVVSIRQTTPIVETYIQDLRPDRELGVVPLRDHYFLGQAQFTKGIVHTNMLEPAKGPLEKFNPLAHLASLFTATYVPSGFLAMIFPDGNGFDRSHYKFEYVRREFLGEVRCYVFDVTPLPKTGKGRFMGRIWAEDHDFTIVRFNGVFTPVASPTGFNLHFDSWRLNLAPGVWLPAYVFSEESDLHDVLGGTIHFKSQTRLWGYDLKNAGHEEEFSTLKVESPTVLDQPSVALDASPIQAERLWQRQAENNVLERLQRVGLLAPPGPVDKVLETVVNNLEVTNNLDIQPEVQCRVLLTSTLESFSIGHTIVMSRGLVDVLPDEPSLATMLAQELAAILVSNPDLDRYGFNDLTMVSTTEALVRLSMRASQADLQVANRRAIELLKNSSYKDKLGTVGLFMKQLDVSSKALTALISPRLGNRILYAAELEAGAPQLQPAKLDQIAALPLGARVKLDPWSDNVDLVKSKPVALISEREKMPFEVTPFMPYLAYYAKPEAAPPVAPPVKGDVAKTEKSQPQTPPQQQPDPTQPPPQPQLQPQPQP